jgi:hypothetical protein
VARKVPTGVEVDKVKTIICSTFTGSLCEQAIRIATCESGLNPNSVNEGDGKFSPYVSSTGLFQHHEGKFPGWDNPTVSTQKAWAKYNTKVNGKIRGWKPWTNCGKSNGLL